MKLHEFPEEFHDLISIVAREKHILESAVQRDYYIVMMLQNLAKSEYADKCVFKGGTSFSKCYPGSIERFSEDIDLTFLGMECGDNECDRTIKKIEKLMTIGAQTKKISEERSNRSKSMYVWHGDKSNQIKLEIGSTVRPDPYSKKQIKSYIQEYLEANGFDEDIRRFELEAVDLNVLNIERTFIDKIMAVKRHAFCGTLNEKVRHIYDVVRLYNMPEIKAFLEAKEALKRLIQLTKETDSFYLERRNMPRDYSPLGPYDFDAWKDKFDSTVRSNYEQLHKNLLYTDEKQSFDEAIKVFEEINALAKEIGE